MKLGICGAPAQLRTAQALGYDYFETSAAGLAAMTPEAFDAFVAENDAARAAGFGGCAVCNGLFPGGLPLVGPCADSRAVQSYLAGLLPRLRRLGVRALVFGSGGARRIPEGFAAQTARRQLRQAALLVAEHCAAADIAPGMEHLNAAETNQLTTLAETLAFVEETGAPGLGVTVDFYHLQRMGEPLAVLAGAAGRVAHCHTCSAGRGGLRAEDVPGLRAQAAALAGIGYDATLSVEALLPDFAAEGAASLAVLRQVYGG